MTDEDLATIRARADAATPGPWYRRIPYSGDVGYVATKDANYRGDRLVGTLNTPGMSKRRDILFPEFVADAEFIAHAREDIPALLAENAAMREIVEAVAASRSGAEFRWSQQQCSLCGVVDLSGYSISHMPDCPVTKARALVQQKESE